MANEHLLKQIVNGLENLAADNAIVCEHLNLRAELHEYRQRFDPTPFAVLPPPYPDKQLSQTEAAYHIGRIADHAALAVLHMGGSPVWPDAFGAELDEADVLRLVLDWELLQSGVYKVIVQLYGQQPARGPALASPGASSEERLWAEVAAWFMKIAADTDRVVNVQHLQSAGRDLAARNMSKKKRSRRHRPRSGVLDDSDPLRRLEQGVQRATLNTLTFAGLLPHHLYHAARARQRRRGRR